MVLGLTSIHPHLDGWICPYQDIWRCHRCKWQNSPYFRGTIVLSQPNAFGLFVVNESVRPQRKSNIRFVTLKITLKISKLFKWFFFLITEGHQQFFPHVFHFDRNCEHDDSVYFTFISVFNTVTLPIHLSGYFTYIVTYSIILCHTSTAFIVLSNISNETVVILYSLCVGRGNPHLIIFSDTAISSTLSKSD